MRRACSKSSSIRREAYHAGPLRPIAGSFVIRIGSKPPDDFATVGRRRSPSPPQNGPKRKACSTSRHDNRLFRHVYAMPSHVYAVLSHVYAVPSHVYAVPSHVYAVPSHVYAVPSHVYAVPSHVYAVPSHV